MGSIQLFSLLGWPAAHAACVGRTLRAAQKEAVHEIDPARLSNGEWRPTTSLIMRLIKKILWSASLGSWTLRGKRWIIFLISRSIRSKPKLVLCIEAVLTLQSTVNKNMKTVTSYDFGCIYLRLPGWQASCARAARVGAFWRAVLRGAEHGIEPARLSNG